MWFMYFLLNEMVNDMEARKVKLNIWLLEIGYADKLKVEKWDREGSFVGENVHW